MGNAHLMNHLRKTQRVLDLALAAGRRNAFRWSVDNFAGGGKRLSDMTEPDYHGRHRFAGVMVCDVVRQSNGQLSTKRALYQLKKLAKLGVLNRERTLGGCDRYYFTPPIVAKWFDEAREFYIAAGLSMTEIRHVELPAIPDRPEVAHG